MNETLAQLFPELSKEQHAVESVDAAPAVEEVAPEEITPPVKDAIPETPTPLSPREELFSLIISGSDSTGGAVLWNTALSDTLDFLDLADLSPVHNVNSLRGTKEHKLQDKIQMANSVLVLAANYGSDTDNQALVDACAVYALKMKTIIKRLCL